MCVCVRVCVRCCCCCCCCWVVMCKWAASENAQLRMRALVSRNSFLIGEPRANPPTTTRRKRKQQQQRRQWARKPAAQRTHAHGACASMAAFCFSILTDRRPVGCGCSCSCSRQFQLQQATVFALAAAHGKREPPRQQQQQDLRQTTTTMGRSEQSVCCFRLHPMRRKAACSSLSRSLFCRPAVRRLCRAESDSHILSSCLRADRKTKTSQSSRV